MPELLREGDVVLVSNGTLWLMIGPIEPYESRTRIGSYCLRGGKDRFKIGDDGSFSVDSLDSWRRLVMRDAGTDPNAIDMAVIEAAIALKGLSFVSRD